MMVKDMLRSAGRLGMAIGLIVAGLVFAGARPAAAIPPGFLVQPPERLYMMPKNPLAPIPAEIVALAVPVGTMKFLSVPAGDLISGDDRDIVVEFTDTQNLPQNPPACDIKDEPGAVGFNSDYYVGNCTRIQMQVTHGTLRVGPLDKFYQDNPDGTPNSSEPAYAVYLTQSGARVDISDTPTFDAGDDYEDNKGVSNLNINGTKQQINDALKLLEYTPDPDLDDDGDVAENDFYKYEGTNPETLRIDLSTQGEGLFEWDVDIRVLDVNDWPDLDGAWELGDGAGDGPADQTGVDPGAELVIPGTYDLTDVDNDDVVDHAGPDGIPGNADDVDDPDGTDGAGDDMMLIGSLDCGVDPLPGYGFHFSSSSFAPVGTTIISTMNFVLGIGGAPPPDPDPAATPEQQAEQQAALDEYDNKVLVRDAFMMALDQTGISDTTLQTGPTLDYGTFFAGIGEFDDIEDALENIYFKHSAPNDSCDVLVIVSDLGNNGLPLQYFSDPDFRQYGVELPFFGVDWDEFTVTTGDATPIDVSFLDPATPLIVNEFGTAEAIVRITPVVHPAFEFAWSTEDGSATDPDDFLRQEATVSVSSNDDPNITEERVLLQFVKGGDGDEPNENFTFQIHPSGGSIPPGYVITSDSPIKNVVIPGTGPQRSILNVTGGAVTEGDTGTANLPFTITLDGPADGIEAVEVDTSSVAPSVAGVDYVALTDEVVTFAPGDMTATVNVVVNGDYDIEPDDLVTLTLSNPVGVNMTGTPSAIGTIVNDDTAPSVTITPAAAQETPTNDDPVEFTVTFDRAVTDFDDLDDVDLGWTGSDGETLVPTITPVDSSVYTVEVTGMTSDGTITASVPAAAAVDIPGARPNTPSPTDAVVDWDNTGPTVTIDQAPPPQTDPTTISPIMFDVVFSEPVTGFTNASVVLSGSAMPTTAVVAGNGTSYTVAVSGMSQDGLVIAEVAAAAGEDAVGNLSAASTSIDNEVTFDFDEGDVTPPTVTINQAPPPQTDPTSVSPIMFDVVFSEPVTGFTNAGVVLSGTAGATTAVVSGNGTTYTVAVSGMTVSGTVIASVPAGVAIDAANHLNEASQSIDNTVDYDLDVTPPTVTINQAPPPQTDPTSVSPIMFDVVFSEPVTGFTNAGVVLSGTAGATTAVVEGNGATYTVAVSGMSQDGLVIADVAAGAGEDAAGNLSAASTSTDNTVTFVVPVVQPLALAIQVPGNIVKDADPNQNGAVVTYPAPTTTGGTAPINITCSHASGAFYPIGVTTVTCTAVDSAPDQPMFSNLRDDSVQVLAALTATGTFTITVNQVDPNTPTTTAGPGPTTIPGSIIPGGTVPGGGTVPPGSTVGAVPPGPQLPQTGSNLGELLAIAATALMVGGLLLLVRRRPAPR